MAVRIFDLLVRCAIAGQTAYFIPERLMEYRFHGGQTSLKQDIHFLQAKSFCLDGYRFTQRPNIEAARIRKLNSLKQVLATRLIEKGETQRGRDLIAELKNGWHTLTKRLKPLRCYLTYRAGPDKLLFKGFARLGPKTIARKYEMLPNKRRFPRWKIYSLLLCTGIGCAGIGCAGIGTVAIGRKQVAYSFEHLCPSTLSDTLCPGTFDPDIARG